MRLKKPCSVNRISSCCTDPFLWLTGAKACTGNQIAFAWAYPGGCTMLFRNRLYPFVLLLLLASLLLAACERPIPGSDAADDSLAAELSEETEENSDAAPETAAESDGETEDAAETGADVAEEDASEDAADAAAETGDAAGPTTGDTTETAAEETTAEETAAEETAAENDADTDADTTEMTDDDAAETEEETPAEDTDNTAASEEDSMDTAAVPAEHLVVAGDTLYKIGLQYGISWVAIATENELAPPYKILVGETLTLPQPAAAAETDSDDDDNATAAETTYIVKAGDNLFRIGLAYGISWVQLAEANGLVNPNQITVGQTLKIPADTPGPAPNFTHDVQPGETLYLISLQYGVSVDEHRRGQ
jgi:LysM repeat protein